MKYKFGYKWAKKQKEKELKENLIKLLKV